LTVPGFDAAGKALTVELTRIQLVGMVFAAVNGVQLAAYHARLRFVWPEVGLLASCVMGLLGTVWLLPTYGVAGVAWMTSFRMAVQTVLLLPGMGRPVWPDVHSPAVVLAWTRIKPLLLGTAYYKTDPLVDRFLLSAAGTGSLSLYYLAQQLYGAATQVINRAVAAPLVPRLSTLHKRGERSNFRKAYHKELLLVIAMCGACLLTLGATGESILRHLIGYSRITEADVRSLWQMMIWLGGMFVGGNAGQICATSFYAVGDTATPTRLSVISYSIYIPCKVAVFYVYGVMGLALVTTIYYLVNLFLQMAILQRALADEAPPFRYP
jgi:putative peptidoglycan lipid II flippase